MPPKSQENNPQRHCEERSDAAIQKIHSYTTIFWIASSTLPSRNGGKSRFFTCLRATIYVSMVLMNHCQANIGTNFVNAPELTSGGKYAPYRMLA